MARKDNIARVLGYGRPIVEEAMTCAANRATLVGHGSIVPGDSAAFYRVPLPASLQRVTEPRSITLTLAWFSPANVRHRAYRRAKLEIQPVDFTTSAGVSRQSHQPSDRSVPRGSGRRGAHPLPRFRGEWPVGRGGRRLELFAGQIREHRIGSRGSA